MPLWGQLLLQLILIFINAVFAGAEIAVVSMSEIRLEKLAKEGNHKARRLQKLTSKPAKFLATIQVSITLAGFLASAFAADNFSGILVSALKNAGVGISESVLETVSVILITIILSYIMLVFGELVPKRIAMRKAEKLSLGVSGLISVVSVIFAPLVWLLTASTNLVLRCLGIDSNAKDDEISEEEILMLVDAGSEKGVIDLDEKIMINNIFEFDDTQCGEVSTHRTDILGLDIDSTVGEWDKIIISSTHSIYPIFKENIDNIVGILDSKKYLRLKTKSKRAIWETAVSKPHFVPENMKTDVLFDKMQKSRNHFAVVLDEYGGTVGIITMNDLLEEIVGDIDNDKSELKNRPDIEKTGEGEWRIQGLTPLDDVAKALNISLPVGDYETFSGYVFSIYYTIPADNEAFSVETDRMYIDVKNVKNHTVEQAVVRLKQ